MINLKKYFSPINFKWWQSGMFKISLISLGIILGVYFNEFFLKWIPVVTLLFVVPGIYILNVWKKQANLSTNTDEQKKI